MNLFCSFPDLWIEEPPKSTALWTSFPESGPDPLNNLIHTSQRLSSHWTTAVRVFRRPVLAAAFRAPIPRNNFTNSRIRNNFRQEYANSHFWTQFQESACKKKFYMILKASSSNCFLKSEHMPWLAYSARLVDITQLHQEQEQQLDLMLYKAYFGCLLFRSVASQVFPSSLFI